MNKLTLFKISITFISIITAFLIPFILYLNEGVVLNSFSDYHFSENSSDLLKFLLILSSLGFFTGKNRFKISGVLLICVAIITLDYRVAHNILAILFFLYTSILMVLDKRKFCRALSLPLFLFLFLLAVTDIFYYEIIGVYFISLYNLTYLLRYLKIINLK